MQWKQKKSRCSTSIMGAEPGHHLESASYTPAQLRDCNDLTRLSPVPGQLDYKTYVRYLALLAHVNPHQKLELALPLEPQNSVLQIHEEAHESTQEGPEVAEGVSRYNQQEVATSWRADQALWTEQNLPEILYSFDRPELWLAPKDLKEPPLKSYQVNGTQLRDIPILPDHISSDLEGWRHVAWTRMDPRISSKDILDRMGPQSKSGDRGRKQSQGQNSTIQMRTARFREDFPALGWVKKGGNFGKDRRKLKGMLEAADVVLSRNTTRGVSWGLVDTAKGESGGRIPVTETKSWPSSVGQQPGVLPVLPTSLPVAAPEMLLEFTGQIPRPLPRANFNQSDSPYPHQQISAPTPERYLKISISSSFGDLSTVNPSFSSVDSIMETPRKRRKTAKFQEANSDLTPISELPSDVPQRSVQTSKKDPYQGAYIRSLELRNRSGTRPEEKRQQRDIPDDLLTSSLPEHPSTETITTHLASQETFPVKLQRLAAQYAAKNAITKQLVQIEPTANGNDEVVTIEYGETNLTLKTYYQRCNRGKDDSKLLTTFHPAGSEERNRQLEYLLDPIRAPYGFQDCNGYEAPIAGVNSAQEFNSNIWYQVTREEALGLVKASAGPEPAVQENTHMISPGVVMYFDGSLRLFDDLRGVPFVWGEVGRARRAINKMNTSTQGHLNAIGGLRI